MKLVSILAHWKYNQPDGFGLMFSSDDVDVDAIAKRIGDRKARFAHATAMQFTNMRRRCRLVGKNKDKMTDIGWAEAACVIAVLAAHNAMPLDDHNGIKYVYEDDDDGMIVKPYPLYN
jgi:hypothetical protein